MRSVSASMIVAAFVFVSPAFGATLEISGGPLAISGVPISLEAPAGVQDGNVAVNDDAGKTYAATVRDGRLVVVLDALGANETKRLTLGGAAPDSVAITPRGEATLDVKVNGELFTGYHYGPDLKKPFLWPVNAEGGVGITRDFPMGEADKTKDHPHHVSLWTAYGNVNGADCWTTGGNSGFQTTEEVTYGSGAAFGWILAKNVWQDKEHKNVVRETREYRFYNSPAAARLMDVSVTFTAEYGDAKFADTKEGGLVSLRMSDALREQGGTGVITTATGGVGEAATWGKPAAWCDYSGTVEGIGKRGITVFDHPGNMRHPTSWHVRSYGLLGANCFGYNDFTGGKENGDFTLKAGESVTFNYRLYVHSGDVAEAGVAERFGEYAAPPVAKWVE